MAEATTIEEFSKAYNRSGLSVVEIAYHAQQIVDDPKFAEAAKALLVAEDEFFKLMGERGIKI